MAVAQPRPWDSEGQTLEDWLTRRLRENPNHPIPNGWEAKDGQVEREQPNWLMRNPWMFPVMGIGAGGALSAAGVGGGGAAAGGMAAENVAPFSGLPGGIGGGGSGAGGAAGLAAQTASGFNMRDLLKYIIGGGAVVGGLTGAGQPDMPEGLEGLLDLQRQRLEASNPLYESVLRLAFSRLPTGATQGLPMPTMGTPATAAQPPSAGTPDSPDLPGRRRPVR
jgi:hypothetical protein